MLLLFEQELSITPTENDGVEFAKPTQKKNEIDFDFEPPVLKAKSIKIASHFRQLHEGDVESSIVLGPVHDEPISE